MPGWEGTGPRTAPDDAPPVMKATVAFVVAAAVLLEVSLAVAPIVPVRSGGDLQTAIGCIYCPAMDPPTVLSFPAGHLVWVHWWELEGTPATFRVVESPDGPSVCSETSAGGSCAFESGSGSYWFELSAPPGATEGTYDAAFSATYTEAAL